MTKPTRDQLKDLLRDSHQRDRRDPTERAKGLDALLAATKAPAPIPPPPSSGRKIVGVAIGVTAVAVAVWSMNGSPKQAPEVVVDAGVVQVVVPPPVVEVVVDAGVAVVEVVDASVPVVVVQPPAPVRPKVIEEEEETPDSLARELTLLDSARKELQTSASSALSTLTTYEREFPRGSMRTEAALVRVEVLLKLGRRADAEKLARSLIAADRDGLVKRRVSKLLDAGVP